MSAQKLTTKDVQAHCAADCTKLTYHNKYMTPPDRPMCSQILSSCDAEGVIGYVVNGTQSGQCITAQGTSLAQLQSSEPADCCAITPQRCKDPA